MFTSFQNATAIAPHYVMADNGSFSETTQQQHHELFSAPLVGSDEASSLQQLATCCLTFLHDSQLMVATIANDIATAPQFDTVAGDAALSAADTIAIRAELAAEAVSRAEHAMLRILSVLRQQRPELFRSALKELAPLSPANSTSQETPSQAASPAVCVTPPPTCTTLSSAEVLRSPPTPHRPQLASTATASSEPASRSCASPSVPVPQQSTPAIVSTVELGIRCVSEIESVWYADRQLPDFALELHSIATGSLQAQISGWRVHLSVEDGLGRDVTQPACRLAPESLTLHFDAGRIIVQGFRFADVSSKYAAGVFRIVAALEFSNSTTLVAPFVSGNIQVLSYRLFHAPKVPAHRLRPEDNLSKMKGIGSMYAKRLRDQGVCCIRDLAALAHDKSACSIIIERIRKERGALTMAKLNEYICEAQGVISRWEGDTSSPSPSPSPIADSSPSAASPVQRVLLAEVQVPVAVGSRPKKRSLEVSHTIASSASDLKRQCKAEGIRSLCVTRDSFDVVESFLGSDDWI